MLLLMSLINNKGNTDNCPIDNNEEGVALGIVLYNYFSFIFKFQKLFFVLIHKAYF